MKLARSKTLWIVALFAAALALTILQVLPKGQPPEGGDAAFRTADQALQQDFADVKARHERGRLSAAAYVSAVRALRTRELKLFAAVRRHHFKDLTESNYWYRGRLKFPGVIEMELQSLHEPDPPAVPP